MGKIHNKIFANCPKSNISWDNNFELMINNFFKNIFFLKDMTAEYEDDF